jgi:hypothetical protein
VEGRLGLADVRLRMQHYPQAEALFAAVAQVRSRERERETETETERDRERSCVAAAGGIPQPTAGPCLPQAGRVARPLTRASPGGEGE